MCKAWPAGPSSGQLSGVILIPEHRAGGPRPVPGLHHGFTCPSASSCFLPQGSMPRTLPNRRPAGSAPSENASDTAALLSMSQVRNPRDFNTFRWRNRSEEARILVSRGADNRVTTWCTYFVGGWRTYCISC